LTPISSDHCAARNFVFVFVLVFILVLVRVRVRVLEHEDEYDYEHMHDYEEVRPRDAAHVSARLRSECWIGYARFTLSLCSGCFR